MSEALEYNNIKAEIRGVMAPGRLKLTKDQIMFKNTKTGKIQLIAVSDIEVIHEQKFVGTLGMRIFTKNGTLHRFSGFNPAESEEVAKYVKLHYNQEMRMKEICVKGQNWGRANFSGSVLSFDTDKRTIFEVPLSNVSQCTTGKNEVALEFHQNDDAPVGLMEMRFHIPQAETAGQDPVQAFQQCVISQSSIISVTGDAIATFPQINCLLPRGRYDMKVFQDSFQMHGKTFNYKIPMDSVLRLFLLPHKDSRGMVFVLSLDPPVKQGQTRYHHLVLQFELKQQISIDLPFSEQELKTKYEGKLDKKLSGPVYEVIAKVMKALVGRKITGPGNFLGQSGAAAISCSFKAAAGYLYPLERGFLYIHKPPMHIRFEEISTVNFARSGGSTRSFDFEIRLKNGTVPTFTIEKKEYTKLFDFIKQKKLYVTNMGMDKPKGYKEVDFLDSDNETEPDVYLERLKAEAEAKESMDEDESDEDFKPNESESDVADEYDSNVESESNDSHASGGKTGSGEVEIKKKRDEPLEKKQEKKKEKKSKKKKEKKELKPKSKKNSKNKDPNKPKRPIAAFLFWQNDMRDQIKRDNPDLKGVEIAKKAGEMWKALKDKSKWEKMAEKDMQRYAEEMKNYKPSVLDKDEEGAGAAKPKPDSPE